MTGESGVSNPLVATARTLKIDGVAGEVVVALRRAGVRAIILKGASIVRWLYDDGYVRPYVDVDLLVAPHELDGARAVLSQLGYAPRCPGGAQTEVASHSAEWDRLGAPAIDLHHTLQGALASPERSWSVLSSQTTEITVGGARVEALAPPALALHVVLHATTSGIDNRKALEDLSRALDRLSLPEWQAVRELATQLDALAAFGVGLRLLPQGAAVAEALHLAQNLSVELVLRASSSRFRALPFEQVALARGLPAKAAVIAREVLPTPSFMRMWSPLPAQGPLGLVLAYLYRPLWILRHAPGGFWLWWRARRRVAAGEGVQADHS